MKELSEYKKNGNHFTLFRREDSTAIFRGVSLKNNSDTWEVIRIQSHNGRMIAGTWFPPAEYPPSNEQWGCQGWTYQSEAAAVEKYMALITEDWRMQP